MKYSAEFKSLYNKVALRRFEPPTVDKFLDEIIHLGCVLLKNEESNRVRVDSDEKVYVAGSYPKAELEGAINMWTGERCGDFKHGWWQALEEIHYRVFQLCKCEAQFSEECEEVKKLRKLQSRGQKTF